MIMKYPVCFPFYFRYKLTTNVHFLAVHLQSGWLQQAVLLDVPEERHVFAVPAGFPGVAALASRLRRPTAAACREYSGPSRRDTTLSWNADGDILNG